MDQPNLFLTENFPGSNFLKVAEAGDYQAAYEDYKDCEKLEDVLSFDQFMMELRKGYGKSGCIEIARLVDTDQGIFYDKEYC